MILQEGFAFLSSGLGAGAAVPEFPLSSSCGDPRDESSLHGLYLVATGAVVSSGVCVCSSTLVNTRLFFRFQ